MAFEKIYNLNGTHFSIDDDNPLFFRNYTYNQNNYHSPNKSIYSRGNGPLTASLNNIDEVFVECYIYGDPQGGILSFVSNPVNSHFALITRSGDIFTIYGNGILITNITKTLIPNKWHHIWLGYNKNGHVWWGCDGVSYHYPSLSFITPNLSVGAGQNSDSTTNTITIGYTYGSYPTFLIDDVRIINQIPDNYKISPYVYPPGQIPRGFGYYGTSNLIINYSSHNFGKISNIDKYNPETSEFEFVLTNIGTQAACSISYSSITSPFSVIGGSIIGDFINSGESATFKVRFAPTSAGIFNCAFNVVYDNGTIPLSVSGEGFISSTMPLGATLLLNFNGNQVVDISGAGNVFDYAGKAVFNDLSKFGDCSLDSSGEAWLSDPADTGFWYDTAGQGNWCFEFWYRSKPDQIINFTPLFGKFKKSSNTYNCPYLIGCDGEGGFFYTTKTGSWSTDLVIPNVFYSDNLWHHICFIRKSGIGYIFLDGTYKGGGSIPNFRIAQNIGVGVYGSKNWSLPGGKLLIDDFLFINGNTFRDIPNTPTVGKTYFVYPFDEYNNPIDANDNNMVFYLDCDGFNYANSFVDKSKGNTESHPISVIGNVYTTNEHKVFSTAAYFYGGNNYLSIPASNDFVFGTSDFTISLWFYALVSDINQILFQKGTGLGNNYYLGVFGNKVYFRSNFPLLVSTTSLKINKWYNILVTRKSNTFKLFINGNLDATATSTASFSWSGDLTIGSDISIGGSSSAQGYIDDIQISKSIVRKDNNFIPYGLVPSGALLHFDDTLLDSSENNHILNNLSSDVFYSYTSKFNKSLILSPGLGYYFNYNYDFDFSDTLDFTTDFWFYPTDFNDLSTYGKILLGTPSEYNYFRLGVFPDAIKLWLGSGGVTWINGTPGSVGSYDFSLDQWYHIALVRFYVPDANIFRYLVFINGEKKIDYKTSINISAPQEFVIGKYNTYPDNSDPIGYIDEFRLIKGYAIWANTFTPFTAAYDQLMDGYSPRKIPAILVSNEVSYDFGITSIGTTSYHNFSITNVGNLTAEQIDTPTVTAFNDSHQGSLGISLEKQKTATIKLAFTPTLVQSYSETFKIFYDDGYYTQSLDINLSGIGASPALLVASPTSFDFGVKLVNSIEYIEFEIENTGTLIASDIVVTNINDPYTSVPPLMGPPIPSTMLSGEKANLKIKFYPTINGIFNYPIYITYYNGSFNTVLTIDIRGIGSNLIRFENGYILSKSLIQNKLMKTYFNPIDLERIVSSNPQFDHKEYWKKVSFEYIHSTGQFHIVDFFNDGNGSFHESFLKLSYAARLGSWLLTRIIILDWDNNKLEISDRNTLSFADITLNP